MLALAALVLLAAPVASPCAGIDRSLPPQQKAALGAAVARQQRVKKAEALASFRSGDWRVLLVDTHSGDPRYLFYAGDAATVKPAALWSGAARPEEYELVHDWVLANVPKVPAALAKCFAWHVTTERPQPEREPGGERERERGAWR